MSSTIKQTLGFWFVVSAALVIAACAAGTGGTGDDDDDDDVVDARRIDAPQVIDAPQQIDARIIDALLPTDAPIVPIDAPMGTVQTGDPCTSTPQCAVAGDCCLFGKMVCMPGTEPIPGFCFPT